MAQLAIPNIKYKNKKANLISTLGTILVIAGIVGYYVLNNFEEAMSEKTATLVATLSVIGLFGGLAMIGIVWLVMRNLAYKSVIRQIEEKGLEPVLRSSVNEAVACYRIMPTGKMEKYLKGLNPEAGAYIAAHRAQLKKE